VLIDALGGMLAGVEGRVGAAEAGLRDALARLRMAYVDVAAHVPGGYHAGDDAEAAAPPPPQRQEGPGVYRPSGLWVPGQD